MKCEYGGGEDDGRGVAFTGSSSMRTLAQERPTRKIGVTEHEIQSQHAQRQRRRSPKMLDGNGWYKKGCDTDACMSARQPVS